jgi:CTP:molybdopterin cytidylyltransferase MocA
VIGAIVLAAGSGSRFGGPKQLAGLGGEPLVRSPIRAAREAGIERVVVVVGSDADAVSEAVGDRAVVVRNDRWREGQSTSLVAGLGALGGEVDDAVVLLADQPGITAEHLRALLDAAPRRPEPIVRLRFRDAPGPALLRRAVWDEVRTLEGDTGARSLIERRPDLVFDVFIDARAPGDVDTPDDLHRLEQERRAEAGHEKPPSF